MGKPKKCKRSEEVKPKPVNCANCHLSCSPSQMGHFTDPLPTAGTQLKKRKASTLTGGQTRSTDQGIASGSINDALKSVFFIHDPGLGQSTPGLCPNCSLVLSQAWTAVNKFRQRALEASTSFLAPHLCQVKDEVDIEPVDTEAFLNIADCTNDGQSHSEGHDDQDPLALSDIEVDFDNYNHDDIGIYEREEEFSDIPINKDLETKREPIFDPNRVLQIKLERLKDDLCQAHLKVKRDMESRKSPRKSRNRKPSPSPINLERSRVKAEKQIAREEQKNRRMKLSKLKKKILSLRKGKTRALETRAEKTRRYRVREEADGPFNCHLCGKAFRLQRYLDTHITVTHNQLWKCSECDESFNFRPEYMNHKNVVHGGPITCTICDQIYKNKETYNMHMVLVHKTKKTWSCENCKRCFLRHDRFLEHDATNCKRYQKLTGERYASTSSSSRKRKPKKKKPYSSERPFKCTICEKGFPYQYNLNRHLKEIHVEKTFQCPYPKCALKFATPVILRMHEQKHVGRPEKEFGCDQCPKFFKSEKCVILHTKNMHERKGRFPCPECPKTFCKAVHLATHSITHRPPSIVCDMCGKLFKHNKNLMEHQFQAHFGEEKMKYKCPSCPRRFFRNELLRLHMARMKHFPPDQDSLKNNSIEEDKINKSDLPDDDEHESARARVMQPENPNNLNMNDYVDNEGVLHLEHIEFQF